MFNLTKNGTVVQSFQSRPVWTDGFWVSSDLVAGGYDGTELVVEATPVPAQVTMRQARLALHSAGLLSGVDLAIAGMTEPAKTQAAIEWEYAQTVDRNAGLVPAMATALGMTESQIDDLFILAATL
jgi:hypothetical protein